jgi:drug/metabolite transporter (DMT)-like permease
MIISQVIGKITRPRIGYQVALAFFAIYIVWGSTYLAIRIVVETVPPLFAAGVRFTIAGAILYTWCRMRGVPRPPRMQWRNLAVLGALMFLATYSGLFWAEKTVPSGIAAVLVATMPVWMALLAIVILKREKLSWQLGVAMCMGFTGVAVLGLHSGIGQLHLLACLAILGSEIAWAIGTVTSKTMALPDSKFMSAGGQMLTGGIMLLAFSRLAGELRTAPHVSLRAALGIGYLIVAGSLIAFTAYVWLLGRMPATTVSSYAYVNPVVALVIGHWLGREALGLRTILGAGLVLASVLLIMIRNPAAGAADAAEHP